MIIFPCWKSEPKICAHARAYKRVHSCAHARAYKHIHSCAHKCAHAYAHACAREWASAFLCAHKRAHAYMHLYKHIHIQMHINVHLHVNKLLHGHIHVHLHMKYSLHFRHGSFGEQYRRRQHSPTGPLGSRSVHLQLFALFCTEGRLLLTFLISNEYKSVKNIDRYSKHPS